MITPLRRRIRKSLADPILQPALDANAERRIKVRREAMASLADPEALRKEAHRMRADVIENLDAYLDEFARNAESNGLIVHRCRTGAEAVKTVLDIAQSSGARRIAKSKTMLGEEIALNPALEAAGLEVVETDLGEYIVQLRGEPPAHIITPAVHLTRTQVGELFHEKLGLPFTEDIPTLTLAARKALREVFLLADIGISGVNAGVADTGSLVVLTNEGNGRMVTTVPRVQVALMGIERLVPSFDDLATVLRLLPRSATGQKLTVYASLINGPRRPHDPDGPEERHLVLVDNGRRAMKDSPLSEILYCIRCGACLNACPVFRELGGHAYVGADGTHTPYPGPLGSVISPGLFGQANFSNLARASSLCGACKEACPVDIDLPKLLLQVRAGGMHPSDIPDQNIPFTLKVGLKGFAWGASHPKAYRLAQRLLGIAARLYSPRMEFMHLPAFTGWGYSKDFPRPALVPFTARAVSSIQYSVNSDQLQEISNLLSVNSEQKATDDGGRATASPTPASLDLVERFKQEAEALGAQVIETDEEQLTGEILAIVEQKGVDEVFAWEIDLPEGWLGRLHANGLTIKHEPDPGIELGLTGAAAGCAETGSILLPGGKGRPLTASLLPETHIAVLKKNRIVGTLEEMLHHPSLKSEAALAIISGPSRTADIEMTLTIGVHGPGELFILLI